MEDDVIHEAYTLIAKNAVGEVVEIHGRTKFDVVRWFDGRYGRRGWMISIRNNKSGKICCVMKRSFK